MDIKLINFTIKHKTKKVKTMQSMNLDNESTNKFIYHLNEVEDIGSIEIEIIPTEEYNKNIIKEELIRLLNRIDKKTLLEIIDGIK